MSDRSEFITTAELVEAYPVLFPSENRVYIAMKEGLLGAPVVVRVGRRVFIHRERFTEWLEAGGAEFAHGWRKSPAA